MKEGQVVGLCCWSCTYIHTPTPHISHHSFAPLGHASHSCSCCVPACSPLLALVICPSFIIHPFLCSFACMSMFVPPFICSFGIVHAYSCLFGLLCLHQIHSTHIIIRKLTFIICIINLDKIIWLVFDM